MTKDELKTTCTSRGMKVPSNSTRSEYLRQLQLHVLHTLMPSIGDSKSAPSLLRAASVAPAPPRSVAPSLRRASSVQASAAPARADPQWLGALSNASSPTFSAALTDATIDALTYRQLQGLVQACRQNKVVKTAFKSQGVKVSANAPADVLKSTLKSAVKILKDVAAALI